MDRIIHRRLPRCRSGKEAESRYVTRLRVGQSGAYGTDIVIDLRDLRGEETKKQASSGSIQRKADGIHQTVGDYHKAS